MGALTYILISLAFSAFFSGMEIAFISSNKLRFELDKKEKSLTSKILDIFYRNPHQFIYNAGRKQYSVGGLRFADGDYTGTSYCSCGK